MYNGYTNYATWRVQLEILEGIDFGHMVDAEMLEEYTEDILLEGCSDLAASFMQSFINQCNFYELAEMHNENYEYDNNN